MNSNKDWKTCFWTSRRSWTTLSLRILSLHLWSLTKASKQTTSWRRLSPRSDSACKQARGCRRQRDFLQNSDVVSTAGHHTESYLSGWGLVSKPPPKGCYRKTCACKTDVFSAPLTQCLCALKETCSQSKLSPILAPQALYPHSPFAIIVLRNVSTCCNDVAHAI